MSVISEKDGRVSVTAGHANLTLGNEKRPIRVAVPIAAALVRPLTAQRRIDKQHKALPVNYCVAPSNSKAFAFYVYRTSEMRQ